MMRHFLNDHFLQGCYMIIFNNFGFSDILWENIIQQVESIMYDFAGLFDQLVSLQSKIALYWIHDFGHT